jgi:hypothetical protein
LCQWSNSLIFLSRVGNREVNALQR